MAQLHEGRRPDQLIKELVQNVIVTAKPEGVLVKVTDDGPDFADITNAYTLMAKNPST